MKKLLRLFFPLSLRVRFLLATAAVVLVLSLAYGMVALIGYSVSFDKTTFRLLRGESNLFYTLAKWENNKLHVELPENIDKQSPTMTLIYDENGQLLWAQRDVPWLMKMIQPDWLKSNGFRAMSAGSIFIPIVPPVYIRSMEAFFRSLSINNFMAGERKVFLRWRKSFQPLPLRIFP